MSRRKFSGPLYQLTATLSLAPESEGGGSSETPVDRYRITTQLSSLDIRSNPTLIAHAGNEITLAEWISEIDTAKDATDPEKKLSKLYPTWDIKKQNIADLRCRGAESYELRRPVLSRVRTVSTNYAGQFVMDAGSPKVYTTPQLIALWNIPVEIQRRLPPTPATAPSNTTWAWAWTQQDSDAIPSLGRVEEMDSWVFAAWSNFLFEIV